MCAYAVISAIYRADCIKEGRSHPVVDVESIVPEVAADDIFDDNIDMLLLNHDLHHRFV